MILYMTGQISSLTKFDADAEYLESNIVFTFEDYTVVRPYDNLNGML